MKLQNTHSAMKIIAQIMNAISQNGVRHNAEVQQAFGESMTHFTDMTPKSAETMGNVFAKSVHEFDAHADARLIERIRQFAQMPMNETVRGQLMTDAQKIDGRLRAQDHSIIGDIAKIGAFFGGVILCIGAVSAGYKFARKPTLLESIFGKR